MKRFFNFAVKRALCLTLTLFVFTSFAAAGAVKEQQAPIILVHTNDVHGHVAVEPYVKGFVDELRAEKRPTVLISAGDAFNGTPFVALSKGMDVATVMNMTGYEIFTMGNHEQFPEVVFQNIAPELKFPILAANISEDWKKQIPSIQDYVIKRVGRLKIAFIGITTGTSGDEAVAAMERSRQQADREGADIYVGVVHLGVQDPDETIRSTYIADHCPWLTVIIDGHCHTVHPEGLIRNGVLIGETGEYGNNIGVIELDVEGKKVVSRRARIIPIKGHEAESGITPDREVQAFIDSVNARNARYVDEVVFTLPIPLEGTRNPNRRRESYFGDLLTDALRWKTKADVAVFPGPGFRADLPAGPITRGELQTALLGGDTQIATIKLSGQVIYERLELAVSVYPNENNDFLQQSGMKIEFDQNAPPGERIVKVTMSDGSELDRTKTYTYASQLNAFWGLPDVEGLLKTADIADYTLSEVVIEYVNSGVEITGRIDNRTKSN
jgi:5'-nucleotidase/UDP-sugar diphosphatase